MSDLTIQQKEKAKKLSYYKYREAVSATAKHIKYSYPNDLVLDEVQEIMMHMAKEVHKELYG